VAAEKHALSVVCDSTAALIESQSDDDPEAALSAIEETMRRFERTISKESLSTLNGRVSELCNSALEARIDFLRFCRDNVRGASAREFTKEA
jgi:hypothetical protein